MLSILCKKMTTILTILLLYLSFCHCFFELLTAGPTVLTCVIAAGVKFSEVLDFAPGQNVSQEMLCFLNCIGEKSGLISEGNIDADKLDNIPMLPKVPFYAYQSAQKCLESLQIIIETCEDMIYVKNCIEDLYL